jgi:hypothetical protein
VAARTGEQYEAGIFDAHLLFLADEALLDPHPRRTERRRRVGQRGCRCCRRVAAADRQLSARTRGRPGRHQDSGTQPPAGRGP